VGEANDVKADYDIHDSLELLRAITFFEEH